MVTVEAKIMGLAGTGKSTRLRRIIKEKLEDGSADSLGEFCFTTFRRKLANEQKNLLRESFACEDEELVNVGTIHAICRRIAGIDPDKILQDEDILEFVKSWGLEYSPTPRHEIIDPVDISGRKNGNVLLDLYYWMQLTEKSIEDIGEYPNFWRLERGIDPEAFIFDYEDFKRKKGLVDFSDMLNIVLENKIVPAGVSFLLTDEFHDLMPKLYSIFKLWAKGVAQVYIAADPFQCIYPFWGTTPDFFYEVKGKLETLQESWRFGSTVWEFAKGILEDAGYEDIPSVVPKAKSNAITRIYYDVYLNDLLPQFTADTFHLARCHYMLTPIARRLIDAGIPFTGDYGWSEWQLSLFNSLMHLKQEGNIGKFGLISLIELHPDEFFAKEKEVLKKEIEVRKESGKTSYSVEEIRQFLPPLSLYNRGNFITSILGDSVLEYASISDSARQKIRNALARWTHPIDKITVYLGTIHSAKGGQAHNVFVWNQTNKRIDRACFDFRQAQDEARVWFVAASRPETNLYWVDAGTRYAYGGGA